MADSSLGIPQHLKMDFFRIVSFDSTIIIHFEHTVAQSEIWIYILKKVVFKIL